MSVTLRKRRNADGSTTLRLDIYRNGQRSIETLKNLKLAKSSNVKDREDNKTLLQQADAIRVARAAELEANNYSLVSDAGKKTLITVWMQAYVDNYSKLDKRNMQGALNRFKAYLIEVKKAGLTFNNLNPLLIEDFIDFLESKSIGEGASSYFNRFKKMVKHAYRERLMKDNVLDLVERIPMLAVSCYSIYFLSYAVLNQVQDFILGIFAPLNKSQKPRAISSIAIGP